MINKWNTNLFIKNKFKIPNLPVPNLENTLEKFKLWVKPLISKVEYKKLEEFIKTEDYSILQNHLLLKAKDKNSSWIIDWWIDSYLLSRGPIACEVGASMAYKQESISILDSLSKVAVLTNLLAKQYIKFKNGEFQFEEIKDQKISLDQFNGFFSSHRIPRLKKDKYYINSDFSTHILFIYKNNLFLVKVIENKKVINTKTIYSTLKQIVESTINIKKMNLNLVSCAINRDDAYKTLKTLLNNNNNSYWYEKVINSIFAIALDEKFENDSISHTLYNSFLPTNQNGLNRWFGNCLTLVVANSPIVSVLMEHTYFDGAILNYLLEKMEMDVNNSIDELNSKSMELTDSQEIEFDLLDQTKNLDIHYKNYQAYVKKLQYKEYTNPNINRAWLKSKGIKSVDAFFHLALQIAQFRTFNKLRNTYIAVDLRNFFRGRTECVRPISQTSLDLVKKIVNKKLNNIDFQKKFNTFENEHHNRIKECKKGLGLNRHLFGLYKAAKELKLEFQIFKTKAFEKINENFLSTSSILSNLLKGFFFWPVEKDGFGISYYVGEKIFFIITSWKHNRHLKEMTKNFDWAIKQIARFL